MINHMPAHWRTSTKQRFLERLTRSVSSMEMKSRTSIKIVSTKKSPTSNDSASESQQALRKRPPLLKPLQEALNSFWEGQYHPDIKTEVSKTDGNYRSMSLLQTQLQNCKKYQQPYSVPSQRDYTPKSSETNLQAAQMM